MEIKLYRYRTNFISERTGHQAAWVSNVRSCITAFWVQRRAVMALKIEICVGLKISQFMDGAAPSKILRLVMVPISSERRKCATCSRHMAHPGTFLRI